MLMIRLLVWAGVVGWGLVLLDFLAGWAHRRTLLRFTWALAALGGGCFLLSRLVELPYTLRVVLDVGLAIGGFACGLALVTRFISNPRVIE